MRRMKAPENAHLAQRTIKILYSGSTEGILFKYLKDKGCFHDIENPVNKSITKVVPEQHSVPQTFSKLIDVAQKQLKKQQADKIYVVCDTDYILQDNLIKECTDVTTSLKELLNKSDPAKIILIPLHPCLEIIFAFHWLQKNSSKNFIECLKPNQTIQDIVIGYINDNLKKYCKENNKNDYEKYRYKDGHIKADESYFKKYLFPILTPNMSNLLFNLRNKQQPDWSRGLNIEQLRQAKSGSTNLCLIEELDCQKLDIVHSEINRPHV